MDGVSNSGSVKLWPRMMVAKLEAYASMPFNEPSQYLDADMLVLGEFDVPALAPN